MTSTTARPSVGDTLSCGHILTTSDGIGTGYARDATTDATSCYSCAVAAERKAFTDAGTNVYGAYVDSDGHLTTWTGGFLAHAMCHTVSRNGWHGSEIHAWRFRAPNGSEWYGRNGGPGRYVTARRARHSF